MDKKLLSIFTGAAIAVFGCSLAQGAEIFFPATQIEKGFGALSVYSAASDKKFSFQVRTDDEIRAVGYSVFTGGTNDIESPGKGQATVAKYLVNPADGKYFWLKAGTGSYELELPSNTVKNTLSGSEKGVIMGAGVRSRLFPDTVVSPAVSVELGVDYERYNLNRNVQSNSAVSVIDKKLEFVNIQAAVVVSKELKRIVPYGGLKVFRTSVTLTDNNNNGKAKGEKDNAGVFIGAKVSLLKQVGFTVESSFVGETSFAFGFNIRF